MESNAKAAAQARIVDLDVSYKFRDQAVDF